MFNGLQQEIRYALCGFLKSPLFTFVDVLSYES